MDVRTGCRAVQTWGPDPIRFLRNRILILLAMAVLCACQRNSVDTADVTPSACADSGFLSTEVHGAINTAFDWRGPDLTCEGMPRPEGNGARLRFAGLTGDAAAPQTVAFILGIPDLEEGETGSELPTNVTLTAEGTGRFFSTQDTDGCWTDVDEQVSVGRESSRRYLIRGTVYCVAPLRELNGTSSISFSELEFSGRLSWNPVE